MKRILLLLILVLSLAITGCGGNDEVDEPEPVDSSEEVAQEEEIVEEEIEDLKEDEEKTGVVELDLSISEREFTLGKSDKNFLDITDSKPTDIRNDVTERWKMIKIAESVDVTEYLVSYTDLYYGENDLVHVIINFNYNTTTVINDFGSYLSVRVHEYVEKEEHDAKDIGSGLQLAEYNIYKDNGDIVDFDKLVESEENED